MNSGGRTGGQYRPLSEEQIKKIHQAALTILEEIGFTYESGLDETLAMLEKAGATLDSDRARIFFPRELVEEQAAKAPERVVLYSRDSKNDLDLTEDKVYLGTGGSTTKVLDLDSGQVRPSTLQDIYQIGRLVDKLDHIHFYLRPCFPTDIPPDEYDFNSMFACLKGTTKHTMVGMTTLAGFRQSLELAAMVAGGLEKLAAKPFWSTITSFAISPLKLCTTSTTIMQEACRHNIPVALSCAPMAGSTAPMTMAGTLAQLHAEQLVGLTIGQLTNPGAPQLYGGIPGAANMRTMGYMGGAVECGMMNAAVHQLAAYIKVPNYNSSGLTDSKIPDAQAGWEKALTTLLTAMGGSNYIHHAAGMLESMLAVAYEQYVIDDEIIGMCTSVLKGIEVDEERLALEAIADVGPGGNFMMSPHTIKHMRNEFFIGNGVSDAMSRDHWEKAGALDARSRARSIAKKLLADSEESRLGDEVEAAIRARFNILL